ncbi:MAG: type II secretion system minor pseudopilin GspJ [Gemmatimonadetes bacterium]|nr:type II secretion system minor pseudopilin GspJ [Gemmatimonadota bacterium]
MEEAATKIPPGSLDLAVAQTQGAIGFLLETALRNRLAAVGLGAREVAILLSLVVVDRDDPGFAEPSKPIGDGYRAALLRDPNAVTLVQLSHAGWPNSAATPRGTVQRVSYRLEEATLIREHWNVTDPTLANEPVERRLLNQVEHVEILYMNAGREWVTQWPPLGSPGDIGFRSRPLAVEITIVLTDYGELRRVIEVAG